MKRYPICLLLVSIIILAGISFSASAQDSVPAMTHFVSADGTLSLDYPASWIVDSASDRASIDLINSEAVQKRNAGDPFASGTITVNLSFIPNDYAMLFGFSGTTHEEQLANLVNGLVIMHTDKAGKAQLTVGDIEKVAAADTVPALTRVSYSLNGIADGSIILWDISSDLMGVAILNTAPGETQAAEATTVKIIESVKFSGSIEAMLKDSQAQTTGGSS